uniref:Uncharacterized protein n=1 Tax=Parascaris univalens TaxID=6257 RepID=A0A914ZY13_PARUN
MTSLEGGSVLPPPRYSSHEFTPTFVQCSTANIVDTMPSASTLNGDDNAASSSSPTRCVAANKTPNSASVASLNHTSSPSPSYPSANSWPGFGGKNSRIDDIQATAVGGSEAAKSPSQQALQQQQTSQQQSAEFQRSQRKGGERVFVFSSKMANEAIGGVQQNKYDSILAWHEANCQPSTSAGEQSITVDAQQPSMALKSKRRSAQEMRMPSPLSANSVAVTSSSPSTPSRPQSSGEARISAVGMRSSSMCDHQPDGPPTSSSDLLMLNDDVETSADNPLRRMERMTQDSLFEPPAKVARSTSGEGSQPARRDQDRNAKLEKMRTLEQQIMIDKARSEWDRMVHEHEAIKMAHSGYPQQLMQGYPPQTMAPLGTQYQLPHSHGTPAMLPAYRRPSYPPQIPHPQGLSPVAAPNGAMMSAMPPAAMPMSQPLRPSLNPPPYGMHLPPEGYMAYAYPPNSFTSQGYPPTMSSVSPAYSSVYPSMNASPMPPRGYSIYPQGMRPIYADKIMPPEMWPQQLPQPLSNLEARIPSQKIQYHPNGTVLDDGVGENVVNMNSMYG